MSYGKRNYCWDKLLSLLDLHRNDEGIVNFIENIDIEPSYSEDKAGEADYEYVEFKQLGFCLCFEHSELVSIFLFSSEKEKSYDDYSAGLPFRLKFKLSVSEVLMMMGEPYDRGGGVVDEFFGRIPRWLRYKHNGYFIHLEFTENDDEIQLLTLASAKSAPE